MNRLDGKRVCTCIVDFYRQLFRAYGRCPRALDYGDKETQDRRFAVLAEILPPENACTVLDVGCGFGDFNSYLLGRGTKVSYSGIDVIPEFMDIARHTYPDAKFFLGDFMETDFLEKYDYVVCSGTLNLLLDSSPGWTKAMIERLFASAKRGVAFNMTSIYTDPAYKNDHTYYADPAEVFTFCRTLGKPVALFHHYLPNDFTIFMFKGDFR